MKKILFSILALCLRVGVANADGIPYAVDAKNYDSVWTQTVYNNYSTADSSINTNDDYCPWITLAGNDDVWTAGVMLTPTCSYQEVCEIVVKGAARTLKAGGDAITADQVVASGADGLVELSQLTGAR